MRGLAGDVVDDADYGREILTINLSTLTRVESGLIQALVSIKDKAELRLQVVPLVRELRNALMKEKEVLPQNLFLKTYEALTGK